MSILETKLRVLSSELLLGMCVVDLDRPWLETPFLFQGFYLQTEQDIKTVQEYCRYVYIDPVRGTKPGNKKREVVNQDSGIFKLYTQKEAPAASTPFERELKNAHGGIKKSGALIKGFMDDIRLGRALNVKAIEEVVSDTVDSVLRNPDALMWLSLLRKKDELQEQHSINVCILSVAIGRHLGLPRDELQKLGICALVHDVGKLQVQDPILQKWEKLTETESAILRKHVDFGRVILMSSKEIYSGAIDVVMTHHEHVDGSGYPRGLNGSRISPFSKIIAIADVYDDIITMHPYKEEQTPFEALKELNRCRGKQFDETLVKHFTDMLGVFPIGSLVELSSGEVAVVVSQVTKNPTQPRLLVVLDKNKNACKETMVNLAALNAQHPTNGLRIVRVLRRGEYGIDPQEVHQRGTRLLMGS